ncbi:unnamed protein product [Lampetra fluviatilis]
MVVSVVVRVVASLMVPSMGAMSVVDTIVEVGVAVASPAVATVAVVKVVVMSEHDVGERGGGGECGGGGERT